MRSYSQDLREKIIKALEADHTQEEVAAQPDVTLAELCERLVGAGAPPVSLATMCAELQRLDLPRKKSRSTTASATRRGSSG